MAKQNKWLGFGLVLAGAAFAIFGRQFLSNLTEDFANGIGVTFKKMKFKFTGTLFTIPVINVSIPKNLTIFTIATIRNENLVGGNVNSANLTISYGNNGTPIAPVTSSGFTLPGNGSVDAEFRSDLNLISTPQNIVNIVNQVRGGELKKLWVNGNVATSFGPVGISQEVPIFAEK